MTEPVIESMPFSDPTATLAEIAGTLDMLSSQLSEGTLPEIGERITLLRQISGQADSTLYALQLVAAENMESDYIHVPHVGWLVRKPKWSTAGSDAAGARRAARTEVGRRMAVDHNTGEINTTWSLIATAAIDLYEQAIALGNPKRGFQDVLGLQLDEYMIRKPAGYSVDIHEELP